MAMYLTRGDASISRERLRSCANNETGRPLHCGILDPAMSAMGHSRHTNTANCFVGCPLHSKSGQTGRHLAMSVLRQKRTHALQQSETPLDYSVRAAEQRRRGPKVAIPARFFID